MCPASIQPQLWVDRGASAVEFYAAGFGAKVLHRVGDGQDIVAQLAIGDAVFWIAATGPSTERLVPRELGATTGRLLLMVDDPCAVFDRAVAAGATEKDPVAEEHGWRIGRVVDPFGHEWEIGWPLVPWPPPHSSSQWRH